MAPSKRLLKEVEDGKTVDPTTDISSSSSRRITRSLTSSTPSTARVSTAPTKKKAKKATNTTTPVVVEKEEEEEDDVEEVLEGSGSSDVVDVADVADVASSSKTTVVVVEHCKQCNSFKTRAAQVKAGLEKAVSGVEVLLNPDKPRKGCFEIRLEGGETFISLRDMKRPFKAMKDLNMDEVISGIAEKLQQAV